MSLSGQEQDRKLFIDCALKIVENNATTLTIDVDDLAGEIARAAKIFEEYIKENKLPKKEIE